MRKYKSKYGKPYIRRLKAGDLKKIRNAGGLWAIMCRWIIDSARKRNKQVYVLTLFGINNIINIDYDKTILKELFTEPEITNKEYNKICNRYKNTAQTDIQCRRAIRRTIQTDQEVKAIQQLGIVAARATKEIAGLKGVQK
ncbi:MAG: hypothetical protein ACLUEZ_11115 [Oscillospiraceae bacterium]|jgi:hypothetical protein